MSDFSVGEGDEIGNIYEYIKELEQNGKIQEVKEFLRNKNFPVIWEELLHHAMVHNNCPVTKRIIIQLIGLRLLNRDEIQLRVSKIVHNVSLSFSERVAKYLKSDEFEEEWQKHSRVQLTAANQLRGRLGLNLLNPNKFSKDVS